jgi:predicted TIM-barrel fold metal-dependent hydrolase
VIFDSNGKQTFMAGSTRRRIDVHHHFWPQRYMLEEQQRNPGYTHSSTGKDRLLRWTAQQAIDVMDTHGIACAIGSISTPGVWFGDVPASRRLSRDWNEEGAKTVHDHPQRFGFFAVVAPPDTEGALKEIEYALDTLKADGIGLLSNYDGKSLGDAAFAPVFDELNRRKSVVFVHPTMHPSTATLIPGLVSQGIEFPFETTRAITSLVLNGTLARCPDIKFIFSHGAGVLPYLGARIEHVGSSVKQFRDNNPDGIEHALKRLYCDTAAATSAPQLAAMMNFFPASHILYGSDYPFIAPGPDVEELHAFAMADATRAAIERDNALALFPRLAGL